ncbi:alpha/beta hydrolase [Ramlibacter sp. AW1]|uniref:Alpha/beta hydrolase n=1 Tax=Ramlibacter aurantiacus TaxID=2801330 RepID=A0A937D7C7_9BURK|nr:alpha/beta hydrolase [Ramlibacter aurantiacus]MBL0421883.1 alpha/beta hydrolase [Ramlibacter aurantiacus]
MKRGITTFLLAVLVGTGAVVGAAFIRDMREAERRIAGRSHAVATSSGRLEYAVAGQGPVLLMIHGTGGGFDQGLTFTEAFIRQGHRVIAPSRFGYLRSDFPDDPSSERQADAFAELLDRLGIDQVPVAGGSAGALSAMQFALRHPQRCSALILVVPAANIRGADPVEMSPLQEFVVRRIAASDLLFWLGLKTRRDEMIRTLLATDPSLVQTAPLEEQQRVDRILRDILPVSMRTRGMLNDAKLAGHPARVDLARIAVPTLVISVEDDRFGTASTARDIAAAVPGARLVIYPSGGHVWVGRDADLWSEVARFVKETAPAR